MTQIDTAAFKALGLGIALGTGAMLLEASPARADQEVDQTLSTVTQAPSEKDEASETEFHIRLATEIARLLLARSSQ